MLRQIRLLSGVQLINLFGINEIRHTKDRGKKARYAWLSVAWLMVILMLVFYVAVFSAAFVKLGMAEIIPVYLFLTTSLVILCFTFFKAGSVIFQMNTFEILVSLPVAQAAIVVSRFLTMYVTNLLLSLLVMLPGIVIYGGFVNPPVTFYVYSILGILFLPLLPLTIATGLGAGITAISSRMRHKSLVSAFLTIFLAVAIIAVSTAFSGNAEQINVDVVKNLADMLTEQIGRTYPPAVWFGNAVVQGKIGGFLLFAAGSLLVFVVLVAVLQKYFLAICAALNATSAKNNYKMQSLSASSPLKALWRRELKRYFASSIYVSNTLMGYILMLVMGVTLLLAGPEKIDEVMGMPGLVAQAAPMVLALMAVIMPTTACSVSMEGKQWWIAQTLPVRSKDIWNSKILVNLTLALPFYVPTVILGILAVKPTFADGIWIAVVPLAYILFTATAGITVNLAMPVFDWENETRAVKQSASSMVTMLVGIVSVIPPFVGVFALKAVPESVVYLVTTVILLGLTAALYVKNGKKTVIF